jgi:hypothetical protein
LLHVVAENKVTDRRTHTLTNLELERAKTRSLTHLSIATNLRDRLPLTNPK